MPGLRSLVARRRATLPTPETPQYSALYPVLPITANSNSFQLASNSFNASVHPAAPASAPHEVSPLDGGPQNGSVAPSYNVYEPGKESGSTVPLSDQHVLCNSTEQQISQCTVENDGHSKVLAIGESKTLLKGPEHRKHELTALSSPPAWSGHSNITSCSTSQKKPSGVSTVPLSQEIKQEMCESISQNKVCYKPSKSNHQTPVPIEQPAQHSPTKQQNTQQVHQIKVPLKSLPIFENNKHQEIPAQQKLQKHQHEQVESSQHSLVQVTQNQHEQQQEQPLLQKQSIVEEQVHNMTNLQHLSQKSDQQQFSHQPSYKQQQLNAVHHLDQEQKHQKNLYLQSQPPQVQQALPQQYSSGEQQQQSQFLPVHSGKPNLEQAGQQQHFLPSSQQDVKVNVSLQDLQSNQHQQPLNSDQLLHFQSNNLQNFQTNQCTQPTQFNFQQSNQQYIQANQQQSIQTQVQQDLSSQNLPEGRNQQLQVTNYQAVQQETTQPTQQTQQQQVSIYPRTAYSAPPPTAFASNVYPHAALQGGLLYNSTLMAATPQAPATYLSLNAASAPGPLGFNTFGAAGPSLLLVPSQSAGYSSMPGYAQPTQTHSYLLPSQGYTSQPTLQTHFLAQPTQLVAAAAQPQQILFPQQPYQPQTQTPYQSALYPSTAYAYSSPAYQNPSYQSPTHAYISPFQATVPDANQQTIAAAPAITLQPTISLQAVAQSSNPALGINPSPISNVTSSSCLASVLQTVPQPSITSLPSSIVNTSLQGGRTVNNTLLSGNGSNTAVVAGTNTLVLQSSNVACSLSAPVVPVNSNSVLQRARSANAVLSAPVSISGGTQFSAGSAAVVITTTAQPLATFVASSPLSKSSVTASQLKVNSPRRRAPRKGNAAANVNKKPNSKKGFDFQDKANATSISNSMSCNENMSVAVVSSELGSTFVPVSSSFSNLSSASFEPSDVPNVQILASASISGSSGERRQSSFHLSGLDDKIEASEPFDLLLHLDALESLQNSMNKVESSLLSSTPNGLPMNTPNQTGRPGVAQDSSGARTEDTDTKSISMANKPVFLPDSFSEGSTELRLEVVKTEPESPTESELKLSESEQTEEPYLIIAERNTDTPVPVVDTCNKNLDVSATSYSKASMTCMPDKKIDMSAAGPSEISRDAVIIPVACCSKLSTTETYVSNDGRLDECGKVSSNPNSQDTSVAESNSARTDDVGSLEPGVQKSLLTPPLCPGESLLNLPGTHGSPEQQEVLIPINTTTVESSDRGEGIEASRVIQLNLLSEGSDADQNVPVTHDKSNEIAFGSENQGSQECETFKNFVTEQSFTKQFQLIHQDDSSVRSKTDIDKNPEISNSMEVQPLESNARSSDDNTKFPVNICDRPPWSSEMSHGPTCTDRKNIPGSSCVKSENNSEPEGDDYGSGYSSVNATPQTDTCELKNVGLKSSLVTSNPTESYANTTTRDAQTEIVHHQGASAVPNVGVSDSSAACLERSDGNLVDDRDLATPVFGASSPSVSVDHDSVHTSGEDILSEATAGTPTINSIVPLRDGSKMGFEETHVCGARSPSLAFKEDRSTDEGISSEVTDEPSSVSEDDLNINRFTTESSGYGDAQGSVVSVEALENLPTFESNVGDRVSSEIKLEDSSIDGVPEMNNFSSESLTYLSKDSGDHVPVPRNARLTYGNDVTTEIPCSSAESLTSDTVESLDFPSGTNEMPSSGDRSDVLPIHVAATTANLGENLLMPEECATFSDTAKNSGRESDATVNVGENVVPAEHGSNFEDRCANANVKSDEASGKRNLGAADDCEVTDHLINSTTNKNMGSPVPSLRSQDTEQIDEINFKQSITSASSSDCPALFSEASTCTVLEKIPEQKHFPGPAVATDSFSTSVQNCAPALSAARVNELSDASPAVAEEVQKISFAVPFCDTSQELLPSGHTSLELKREAVAGSQTESTESETHENSKVRRGRPKSKTGNQPTCMPLKSQKCEDLRSVRRTSDTKHLRAPVESMKTLRSQSRLRSMGLSSEGRRTKLLSPLRSPRSRLMRKFLEVRKGSNVPRAKRQLITSRAGLIVDKSLQARQGRSNEGRSQETEIVDRITDVKEERLRDVRISKIRDGTNTAACAVPSERIVLKMKLLSPNQKDKSDGKVKAIQALDTSSSSTSANSEWTIDNKTEINTPHPSSSHTSPSGKWKSEAVKEGELKVKLKQEKSMPDDVYKFDCCDGDSTPLYKSENIYVGPDGSELVEKDPLSHTGSGDSRSSGSNSETVSRRSSVDSSVSSRRSSQCSDVSEASHYTDASVASCSTNASSSSSGSEKGVQIVIKKLQDCEGYSCFRTKKKKIKLEGNSIPEEAEDVELTSMQETDTKLCFDSSVHENTKTFASDVTVQDCQVPKTAFSFDDNSSPSKSAQKFVEDTNPRNSDHTPDLAEERSTRKYLPCINRATSETITQSATRDCVEASNCLTSSGESSNAQETLKFGAGEAKNDTLSATVTLPAENVNQIKSNPEPSLHNDLLTRSNESAADNTARPKRKAALLSQEKCLVTLAKLDSRTVKKPQETMANKNVQTESRASQSRKTTDSPLSGTESKVFSPIAPRTTDEVNEDPVPRKRSRGRPRLRGSSRPGSALSTNVGVKRDASLSPPRPQCLKKKLKEFAELEKCSNETLARPSNVHEYEDVDMAFSEDGGSIHTDKKNSLCSPRNACSNDRPSEPMDSHEHKRVSSRNSENNLESRTGENDSMMNSSAVANCNPSHVAAEDKSEIDTSAAACENDSCEASCVPTIKFDREPTIKLPKLTASMIVMPLSAQMDVASSPRTNRAVTPSPDSDLFASDHLETVNTETLPNKTVLSVEESIHRSKFRNTMIKCTVSLSNIFYDCKLNHLCCPGCSESLPPHGIMVDVAAHVMHMLCLRCDWLVVRKLSLVDVCA